MSSRIAAEARSVHYRDLAIDETVGRTGDEQVAREEAVPRAVRHDPYGQTVLRICAGGALLNEGLPAREVVGDVRLEGLEMRRVERPVDRSPPDLVLCRRFANDVLVLGRAAGVGAGGADEGSRGGQYAFPSANGFLAEPSGREVPEGGGCANGAGQTIGAD